MSTYEIIRLLGKGGMGEVWLAKDPLCERDIALKKLRQDLRFSPSAHERFMREAKIAAKLSHPSIIPVYTIHDEGKHSFYTMPYVEGQTLKEILHKTRKDPTFPEGSIPNLLRIFVHVCQAVAHAHEKNILHRDLKPDNVIVGKQGEVMILDWGLAGYIDKINPKKIDGTLTHMAPERAFGVNPSTLHDVYALGVILYQILTLRLPFRRTTLEQFRKTKEQLQDPCEVAPYRDIPLSLAHAVKQCLAQEPSERIQHASTLITILSNYMDGRPEWIHTASLKLESAKDWEFQEHILLAKHIALSGKSDLMEWTYMMVSKLSFSGNIKIQTTVRLDPTGSGIGFLLDIPSAPFRTSLEEGYCIWLTPTTCSLFRKNVEILTRKHNYPVTAQNCFVCIEKIDNTLHFFINEAPIFDYTSYLPSRGEHIGLLYKDTEFCIEALTVSLGSQNVQVSCLAVPDAFLAHRQFGKALIEYKRIARCFPGRKEGREALFRAGVTLLEAHSSPKPTLCIEALDTFSCLRKTPGAPLEYLGKALVYQAAQDTEEEIKCLELALRKYAKHPELPTLIEHTIFRLHEASCKERTAGYRFALLALTHLPHIFEKPDHKKLLETLESHIHPTYFATHLDVRIAFWLAKPLTLLEIAEKTQDNEKAIQALFALLELGFTSWVEPHAHHVELCDLFAFQKKKIPLTSLSLRAQHYMMKRDPSYALIDTSSSEQLDALRIRTRLEQKDWKGAQVLLDKYPIEKKACETSPLYPLFGCWLFATEGKEIALHHFTTEIERTFPPLPALLGYYIKGKICLKKGWISQAFFEEKRTLFQQLKLFFLCIEDKKMHSFVSKKAKNLECDLLSSYTLPETKS